MVTPNVGRPPMADWRTEAMTAGWDVPTAARLVALRYWVETRRGREMPDGARLGARYPGVGGVQSLRGFTEA